MSEPLSLESLAGRCQKRNHATVGNWMARRISRPAALRVTRVLAPLGVGANMATMIAWMFAVAAAGAFAWGTPAAWLVAVVLFQAWYLWDHVDGQLARLRGTVSLEGAQLDYLMHHTVNLLIPLGVGYGCFAASGQTCWLGVATAWAVAMLVIPLRYDTAYRAIIGRLQHLEGTLTVSGRGVGETSDEGPSDGARQALLGRLARVPRKANEVHVVMNALTAIAVLSFLLGDAGLTLARGYLAVMAAGGLAVAAWSILRGHLRREAEAEFGRYFQVPRGHILRFRDGLWRVEPAGGEEGEA